MTTNRPDIYIMRRFFMEQPNLLQWHVPYGNNAGLYCTSFTLLDWLEQERDRAEDITCRNTDLTERLALLLNVKPHALWGISKSDLDTLIDLALAARRKAIDATAQALATLRPLSAEPSPLGREADSSAQHTTEEVQS